MKTLTKTTITFQSGRIELATETLLIVPDNSGPSRSADKLYRVYKSKLLTDIRIFENVVKGPNCFIQRILFAYFVGTADHLFDKF